MVKLSKAIATKIKDKQGDVTDDEVCTDHIFEDRAFPNNIYM